MTHGSLFSGIGGFDLASEWMGWENVFHCEINPFGQKILKYYWPNSISYDDITKTDFSIHRGKIDILTGGFPCQPFSLAGKRKGTADDRHLWPEMLRCIREIQPQWIVGENVFGLINWDGGMVFDQVQTDLEAEGYEVQPYVLPACAVNAPHRRDRVWFVAHAQHRGYKTGPGEEKEKNGIQGLGREKMDTGKFNGTGVSRDTSHTHGDGCDQRNSDNEKQSGEGGEYAQHDIEQVFTPNSGLLGPQERKKQTAGIEQRDKRDAADTKKQRFQEWDAEPTRNGTHTTTERYNIILQWENFPTQPPICSGNDELSLRLDGITFPKWRTESIKAYGNAVVPQVVFQIFKAIEKMNKQ